MASRIKDNRDRLKRFAEPAPYAVGGAGLYSEVSWTRLPSTEPSAAPIRADERERSAN